MADSQPHHQGEALTGWSLYMRQSGFRQYGHEEVLSWDCDPALLFKAGRIVEDSQTPEEMWAKLAELRKEDRND